MNAAPRQAATAIHAPTHRTRAGTWLPRTHSTAATTRAAPSRAAFRAYTEETYRAFPLAQFTAIRTYAVPGGLVGRYHGWWRMAEGRTGQQEGAVVFAFRGVQIARIGVHLDARRLRALLAHRSA